MELSLQYGLKTATVRVDQAHWLSGRRPAPGAPEQSAATLVRDALQSPHEFPPLSRSLTDSDHIAIVAGLNTQLLSACLPPIMDCLHVAGIPDENVTIIYPPGANKADETAIAVRREEHQPDDPRRLAYLATTQGGRRIYLNRTVIDADQVIVVSEVRYRAGRTVGGVDCLFPTLSDTPTRAVDGAKLTKDVEEVGWLLGLPLFVHVMTDSVGRIIEAVAGPPAAWPYVAARLQRHWLARFERPSDLVIATVTGAPQSQSTTELASALTHAAAVARSGATIVLLCEGNAEMGPAFQAIAAADSPRAALKRVQLNAPPDLEAARQWLEVVRDHRVLVLSGWPESAVEDLFATPLTSIDQVQRVIDQAGDCLSISDAHRTLAEIHEAE